MDYFTEGLQFSYSYYILVLSRFSAFELIGDMQILDCVILKGHSLNYKVRHFYSLLCGKNFHFPFRMAISPPLF